MRNPYDWKSVKKGFPYKGTDDPKYIKDRDKFFKDNGNGWWYFQGTYRWKEWYAKSRYKNQEIG
jgi:hypothetical protein